MQKTQNNFLLTAINIISICYFIFPPPSWCFPIYLILTQINFIENIRRKLQIISLCSLAASFIVIPWLSDLFGVIAFSLAINVGYRLDTANGSWLINSCLAIGVIIGNFTQSYVQKYLIGRDMIILICTLPNLFMAQNCSQKKHNSTLWFFNPFYDRTLSYSIGFLGSMFLPLSTSVNKYTRFLIISLILLMTTFVQQTVYQDILSFIRGFFIYDETRYNAQLYFLIGFILVDIFVAQYKFNYLFIGYLVISVMLWHRDQYRNDYSGNYNNNFNKDKQKKPLQKPLLPPQKNNIQIQMKNMDKNQTD